MSACEGVTYLHPHSIIVFVPNHGGRKTSGNMDADLSHLDDESLIQRIRKESHEAFAVLVKRYSKRFYSIAYRLVINKADAEDIVQEAFLKVWYRPQLWNPDKQVKFTTWFYKVIINLCLDHNKKKKPLALPEDLQLADKQPGQDVLLDIHQRQALLNHFMQKLPERQELALNLCFYEGLSNKEAAEIIGVEVKALQSLIMRAKTTLKGKVKRYMGGGSISQ
jgi:RNA polymerase sigma-70 factor (ECF subfamily)